MPSPNARRTRAVAVVDRESPTVRGRVDQRPVRRADDEVSRQSDPVQVEPDPPRDLELHDRQADRQADPTLEDAVELAVPGIDELGCRRSSEAGLAVEDVMQAVHDDPRGIAPVEADPDALGQEVETRDRRLRGEPALSIVAGDAQRTEGQIDLRVRPRDQPGEPGPVGKAGRFGGDQLPGGPASHDPGFYRRPEWRPVVCSDLPKRSSRRSIRDAGAHGSPGRARVAPGPGGPPGPGHPATERRRIRATRSRVSASSTCLPGSVVVDPSGSTTWSTASMSSTSTGRSTAGSSPTSSSP